MTDGADTLWAVVVGAVLATVGGFSATRLEEMLRRRERERAAALLFGEILSALALITVFADESRQRGDPYGSFTLRMLRAARRETDAYERNRESLYDLREPRLRARIHTLVVRVTLGFDGVLDTTALIDLALAATNGLPDGDPGKADAQARIEQLMAERQLAFDAAVETLALTKPIITMLEPLAKQSFDVHATVARDF
jgi:hypothetical protein